MARTGPFSGLTIIEASRYLPGALCTLFFADLGADVIKVEDRRGGDPIRGAYPDRPGYGPVYSATCRNKRSVTLDLKSPAGIEAFGRLAAKADVVVESFRPGVARRLGIDHETLMAANPALVYCSITGFGQTGPFATRAGHDLNYLAATGCLELTMSDGRPVPLGMQVADIWGGGTSAALGISFALLERHSTGRGRYVDTAMFDGLTVGAVNHFPQYFTRGGARAAGAPVLTGGHPNYGVYAASDGFVAVADWEDKFWANTCEALGRPDLVEHKLDEGEQGARVRAELEEIFSTRTRAEWAELFDGVDSCFMPVWTVDEAAESEHLRARGLVIEVGAGDAHERQLATPLTGMGGGEHRPAPRLGADTDSVLGELGYSTDEIASFRQQGVV